MPLKISIPSVEEWDPIKNEFYTVKEQTISLEHSLVSMSKWEAKWQKPFLNKDKKTDEETLDYIKCMTVTQNVDPLVYDIIAQNAVIMDEIGQYINNPMTATTIKERKKASRGKTVTTELIYYWMVELDIPFECQKWHFNRLMTLINVCNEEQSGGGGKMSSKDILKQNKALNRARRSKSGSRG